MKRNLTTVKQLSGAKAWKSAKPLLGKLIKWTVWAVLAATAIVVIIYIAGSYRKASDDSQLAIVRIALVLSLLLIISSIYGILLDFFYIIKRRQIRYLAGIAGYMLIMVLGVIIALVTAFIIGSVGGHQG